MSAVPYNMVNTELSQSAYRIGFFKPVHPLAESFILGNVK